MFFLYSNSFFFILFLIFINMFLVFRKKLLVLLSLELFMLLNIFFFSMFNSGKNFSLFYLFIFSVIMVLESVFGISLLVSTCRSSADSSVFIPQL